MHFEFRILFKDPKKKKKKKKLFMYHSIVTKNLT